MGDSGNIFDSDEQLDRSIRMAPTDLFLGDIGTTASGLSFSKAQSNFALRLSQTYRNLVSGFSTTRVFDLDETNANETVEPLHPETSDAEALNSDLNLLENTIELKEEIAKGGQGRINKGYDKKFCRTIAVKSLHEHLKGRIDRRKAFISEAKVTAQLEHPAIIPVYGLFEDDDNGLHLSMKLIRGRTLKEYLERTRIMLRQIPKARVPGQEQKLLMKRLDTFQRVCEAISYVHHRRVVHRDLKPENIMIGSFHETYVMDWGIAEYLPENTTGSPENLAGTLQYIAPEVINKKPYDHRSDIFLLGLILYEIVFLKQAYAPEKDRKKAVIKARTCQVEPFEHRFGCVVDIDLKMIIAKALAPSPNSRYQSVKALESDLRKYNMGDETSANPDGHIGKILRKMRHHYKILLFTSVFMLLLFSILCSLWLYREVENRSIAQKRESAMAEIYSKGLYSCTQFDMRFKNYEYLVSALARATALLLDSEVIDKEYKFYTYEDGKDPEKAPPGFAYAPVYRKQIDTEHMIFVPPPHEKEKLSPEMLRTMKLVSGLEATLRETVYQSLRPLVPAGTPDSELPEIMRDKIKPPLMVAYVELANGLTVGYPYELDYSDDYEPTKNPWYKEALDNYGKPYWDPPDIDIGELREIVLTCSRSVINVRGQIVGVAHADISLNSLIKMLDETGNSGSFIVNKLLIDTQGRVMADSAQDFVPTRVGETVEFAKFEPAEHLQEMWAKKNGWIFYTKDKVNYLYFYLEIKTLNMLYVELINFDELIGKR